MNVLQQYLVRKNFDAEGIARVHASGCVRLPPNWTNYFVDGEMMFSHRCNRYTCRQYTNGDELHAHRYYEIVIHIRGKAEYIQNDRHIHPSRCTVICSRPETMHAVCVSACEYERYLMYFSPAFFARPGDPALSILEFAQKEDGFALQVSEDQEHILLSLLQRIEHTLSGSSTYKNLLAKGLIAEVFDLFNTQSFDRIASHSLSDSISEVKKYIDRNYGDITGTEQIAEVFHYSREHLSRKFKKRFGTTVSEYLSLRRVTESTGLMEKMSITEACFAVGFGSMSAYIGAFKKHMGCLPSEYKKQLP